jgi:hypothetical protein
LFAAPSPGLRVISTLGRFKSLIDSRKGSGSTASSDTKATSVFGRDSAVIFFEDGSENKVKLCNFSMRA